MPADAMRCARGSDVSLASAEISTTQEAIRASKTAWRGSTTIFLAVRPKTRKTRPTAVVTELSSGQRLDIQVDAEIPRLLEAGPIG
jgi:hypothetical protein